MKKNEKLTIAERRAALESEMSKLESLQYVEDTINDIIDDLNRKIEWEMTGSRVVGQATEQFSTSGGLCWKIPNRWSYWSDKEIADRLADGTFTEEEVAQKAPYYSDIYEQYEKSWSELSDYEQQKVNAYKMIIEYLNSMEY